MKRSESPYKDQNGLGVLAGDTVVHAWRWSSMMGIRAGTVVKVCEKGVRAKWPCKWNCNEEHSYVSLVKQYFVVVEMPNE